jgi:hypothetical protein
LMPFCCKAHVLCRKKISHHVEEDFNALTDVVEQRKKKDRHSNPIYLKLFKNGTL